jgi:hypothetical protein
MAKRCKVLTDDDVQYVRRWTSKYDIGEVFKFSGWKDFYSGDDGAPAATTIGGQVVEALEESPADPRLDFIGLAEGPGKGGKVSDKTSSNAQYYTRLK